MQQPADRARPEIAPTAAPVGIPARSAWILAEPRGTPEHPAPATGVDQCSVAGNCSLSSLVGELVAQIDAADPSQTGHATRVAALATMLGSSIGMEAKELRQLRIAALLHDVGKILVPAAILQKAGPLTTTESSTIRRHTVYGGMILRKLPALAFAAETARWHHERWDGLGYPDGMVGNAIPLHARIVGVADALDAMTSVRAYRQPMPLEQAFEELEAQSGAQFDPMIVAAVGPLVGATGFRDSWETLSNHIEALPAAA
jgi:HD-GYP domain-containing protein (c-di-GMP phosphodiesterase class II)